MEDACERCLKICRRILCEEWAKAKARFADDKDPIHGVWDDIEANLDAVDNEEEMPVPVHVPSAVHNSTTFTEEFFQEVAFVTEKEFLKWVGATPSTLGVPLQDRLSIDGQSMLRGVHVALHSLPATMSVGDVLSLRRVRVSCFRELAQDEFLLQPDRQIHPGQAKLVRSTACKALMAQRCPHVQLGSIDELPTLQSFRERAVALEDERQRNEGCQSGGVGVDARRSVQMELGSLAELPLGSQAGKKNARAKSGGKNGPRKNLEKDRDGREGSPSSKRVRAAIPQTSAS